MADCKNAGIVAAGLLGTAALLVFINHLIGVFDLLFTLLLLPGAWLAMIFLGGGAKPGPITFLLFVAFMSYCWYFILSYFVIKIYRAMYPTIPESR
jgi:hypothetical protein